jgi:hypothetical protein
MDKKPRVRLYLDVDGVLSTWGAPTDSAFDDWREEAGTKWSPSMVGAVGALDVDLTWLTTWGERANSVLAPLYGWPEKPALAHGPERTWWKLDALVTSHTKGVPFIWVDDEMNLQRHDLGGGDGIFERFLDWLESPILLICPRGSTGLSPEHLEAMGQFIATHAS